MTPAAETVDNLPAPVLAAFAGRVSLTLTELAITIEIDAKTLRRHIAAGNLTGRRKGVGEKHVHRVFGLDDVRAFWTRIGSPCPSTSIRSHPTGTLTSNAMVFAFPVRPKSLSIVRVGKRKRSRRISAGDPMNYVTMPGAPTARR